MYSSPLDQTVVAKTAIVSAADNTNTATHLLLCVCDYIITNTSHWSPHVYLVIGNKKLLTVLLMNEIHQRHLHSQEHIVQSNRSAVTSESISVCSEQSVSQSWKGY